MKKLILTLTIIFLISSCAKPTPIILPSGEKGFAIQCGDSDTWTSCYEIAGEMCPRGYDVSEEFFEKKDKRRPSLFPLLWGRTGQRVKQETERTLFIKCKYKY